MFWKSNKEAKDEIFLQRQLISNIENILEALAISQVSIGEKIDKLYETMVEIFTSEEEGSCLNRIHNKLNTLIDDEARDEKVRLAHETLDKFDIYMQQFSKLNAMINEFKGCVMLARAAFNENKGLKKMESNIDAIYKTICEIQEKKSPKRRKKTKKKKDFPASQSEGSE